MYPSPNLRSAEISLNTSTSAVSKPAIYLPRPPPAPLALTITPIFGEREFVFSTRIPIIILFVAVKQNECDGQSVELFLHTLKWHC